MRKFLTVILCAFFMMHSMAQVKVETVLDSLQIFIGEQAHLTVGVTMKDGQQVLFPEYKYTEQLTPGVEVLEASDADTIHLDDGLVKVSRQYTITSFDDTLYYLPPMKVKVDGKEYAGKNLALKVLTIEVDTLHPNQIFPAKEVQDNPFLWSDWSPAFWMSVALVLLLALLYYLFIRLRDNKPVISRIRIIRKLLPHQKAMMEIQRIKADNAKESEDQKDYYTRLTDTLRVYLEERFGFQAMEMTSGEIIDRLKMEEDQTKFDELRQLLEIADLVKFAKYSALMNERDQNMVSVIEFIESTKKEDMPTIEKIKPDLSESEKRTKRSRIVLITLLSVGSIAAVAMLIYVLWQVYLMAF